MKKGQSAFFLTGCPSHPLIIMQNNIHRITRLLRQILDGRGIQYAQVFHQMFQEGIRNAAQRIYREAEGRGSQWPIKESIFITKQYFTDSLHHLSNNYRNFVRICRISLYKGSLGD